MRPGSALFVVLLVAACQRAPSDREPAAARADPSLDEAIAESVASERERQATSRELGERRADRWSVRQISAEEPPLRPIGIRRFVNVRFANADLEDALRLLAEAGGFAMIADGDLSGQVTAELRHVRPFEALTALAEAHHARVERHGSIVVVSQGGSAK